MLSFKTKTITLFIVILSVLFFACSLDINAAKKKKRKKSKVNYELQVQKRKVERLKKLYQYFPVYEEWEKAGIYPYNDFAFLSNFDTKSIFEDFYLRKRLLVSINNWLGVRYRLPGRSRQGVDCSNFVSLIIFETLNLTIPAGASGQSKLFSKIEPENELQFGDLVFFSGRNKKSKRIGHVGIYIGNGLFAHSATNHGVTYTHLDEGYYKERYRFGSRIHKNNIALLPTNNYLYMASRF